MECWRLHHGAGELAGGLVDVGSMAFIPVGVWVGLAVVTGDYHLWA